MVLQIYYARLTQAHPSQPQTAQNTVQEKKNTTQQEKNNNNNQNSQDKKEYFPGSHN